MKFWVIVSLFMGFNVFGSEFLEKFLPEVERRGQAGSFVSQHDKVKIAYSLFKQDSAKGTVVFATGRTEFYLKYSEFILELLDNGYNVAALDWRGQGLSGRMVSNKEKGYVKSYQHYIDDLEQFLNQVVKKELPGPFSYLGLSMGGHIGVRHMAQFPGSFEKAILVTPMLGIDQDTKKNKGKLSKAILFRLGEWWAKGQKGYKRLSFEEQIKTHSRERHEAIVDLLDLRPELRLGGATNRYAHETFKSLEDFEAEIPKVQTPLLIIMGSEDKNVNNDEGKVLIKSFTAPVTLHEIQGSRHEVLLEIDQYRNEGIQALLNFLP